MLANSQDYWQSRRQRMLTPGYKQALARTGLTHEQVKAAEQMSGSHGPTGGIV